MLCDIINSDEDLIILLKLHEPEHVYFVNYLQLLTKLLFTEHGTYNPYNLNIEKMRDDQVNDIMYLVRIFDGFDENDNLEKLYNAIVWHYKNVYGSDGDGVVVDANFWLQRLFFLVQFITDYTHFKLNDSLQIIYLILGIEAYSEWDINMERSAEFFHYVIKQLSKTKFGDFY